jgi:ketosteroid isomerase-like protein
MLAVSGFLERSMQTRITLLAAVLLSACQQRETSEPPATGTQAETDLARSAIAEGNARWVRWVNQNQPDSLATLYVPNGVVMPPDVRSATGRDSIAARVRPLVIPGGTLSITSENLSVSGPIAVSRGVFSYTAPAQGGNPAVNLRGKYLEHWHNVDGQWLIAENIWNSDAPMPQPTPRRSR